MASFWPWRRDRSSSTANFEKTLSTLQTKIAASQGQLDRTRASARRSRALITLYFSFAYLVYAIVLFLVVGWNDLGVYEWTGLAGAPVLTYGIRRLLTAYFAFRTDSLTTRLKEYQDERAKTIQKLKDATKYDSTLELIEKYGGTEGGRKGSGQGKKKNEGEKDARDAGKGGQPNQAKGGAHDRTRMPPPPTANIQRKEPRGPPRGLEPGAEFAPNADFADSPHFSPSQAIPPSLVNPAGPPPPPFGGMPVAQESHWYDRILDTLLGEDETSPKNRLALICQSCRLVNGVAPPGTSSLADVGPWRCMTCGVMNNESAAIPGHSGTRSAPDSAKASSPIVGAPERTSSPSLEGTSTDDAESDTAEGAPAGVDIDGPASAVKRRRAKAGK